MESYPDDIFFNIAIQSSIEDINNLCLTCHRINNLINNNFWRHKCNHDYKLTLNATNWKHIYLKYRQVYAFGLNNFGQLGVGDDKEINTPIMIPGIKAQSICCSQFYTMIIDLNSEVWAFGDNEDGKLGYKFSFDFF